MYLTLHGTIDESNPLNSALVFAQNERLLASDLYNQQLQNGLTVLTVCNTGNGVLKRGEGIMSLSRAFAFAGSPSMMVSLWSIDDKSTTDITRLFNQYLKDGKPKDEALQLAKKAYLNDVKVLPNQKFPSFWSPCIITGDVEPLFPTPFLKIAILGCCIFMSLLFYKGMKG